jgi:hypothetical protein
VLQLFDPSKGVWSAAKAAPFVPSAGAVVLRNGRVLVLGTPHDAITDAMLYDPATNTWTNGGNLSFDLHDNSVQMFLLNDGRVLLIETGGRRTPDLYSGRLAVTTEKSVVERPCHPCPFF